MSRIGTKTVIYKPELSNIAENVIIGDDCKIHSHVWIGENVKIGNNCKIQAFSFIPTGVFIKNNVFIGPRVTFTNDKKPPSKGMNWAMILVEDDVVIGAGAIILPGLVLKTGCFIAAGAVVTKDVQAYQKVLGVPARPFDGIVDITLK